MLPHAPGGGRRAPGGSVGAIGVQEGGGSAVFSEAFLYGVVEAFLLTRLPHRTRRGQPEEGTCPRDVLLVGKHEGQGMFERRGEN